jgi:O-antigen/teichoic acid export membrane protein
MVNNIPAQANVASENLRLNIPASFTNFISYTVLVVLTLLFGWGIIGLAIATFTSRTLEALVRYVGVRRRLQGFERHPIPSDLKRRMFTFSQQNLFLLGLGLVVWDRSELLFLKHYSGATEVAFYSLAFSITNQLLMAPRAFSSSIGVTVFAQYGRDASRLDGLMRNATRYVGLLTIPLFLGLAAIADPLIRTVYGPKYLAVIPVLVLMSVFALPRGFQSHIENLLQAHETQGFMVRWLSFVGVLNLLLDWLLIPSHGALGAAVANGVAQSVAIAGVWVKATSVVHLNPPVHFWRRIGLSGAAIVAVVVPLQELMPASAALIVGVMAGAIAFAATVRMTRCLEAEDFVRFRDLSGRMPTALQPACMSVLTLLIPRAKPQLPEPANIL